MISYKNILAATDYSEDADIALMHAVDLAKRYGARLHILHVLTSLHRYRPEETITPGEGGVAEATKELIEQKDRELRERYAKRLAGLGQVATVVKPGVAFVEIVRHARENDIDLIVMGASGKSELSPVGYGSTVENVSRRAHCHVMAIRNPEKTYTL